MDGCGSVLLFFFFFFFVSMFSFLTLLQCFPSKFPAAICPAYLYHHVPWIQWYDIISLFSHWLRKTTRPTYRQHLSQALVSLHGGKMRRSWNPPLHQLHCVVSSQWRSLENMALWTWIISVPSLLPCIKPVAHKFRTGWLTHQKQVECMKSLVLQRLYLSLSPQADTITINQIIDWFYSQNNNGFFSIFEFQILVPITR